MKNSWKNNSQEFDRLYKVRTKEQELLNNNNNGFSHEQNAAALTAAMQFTYPSAVQQLAGTDRSTCSLLPRIFSKSMTAARERLNKREPRRGARAASFSCLPTSLPLIPVHSHCLTTSKVCCTSGIRTYFSSLIHLMMHRLFFNCLLFPRYINQSH